jgi:thymidylate synthase (FAD)
MQDIIQLKYGTKEPFVKCLDHGFVKLVDCMPRNLKEGENSADYVIAEAARCSYQRGTKTIADDKTLIRYLMRHDHTSPFEMIEFKFHCKLPIFVARQIIRHRSASLNELSGRYSEMPEEYYVPENNDFRTQSKINTQGSEGIIDEIDSISIKNTMNKKSETAFKAYHILLKDGLVREQARIILPLNTYTEWYWKIDLKNLLHFLDLRCDSHAQKETRVYAEAILELIKPIVPWVIEAWEDYSPYRGGIKLSRLEVKALRETLNSVNYTMKEIDAENKYEKNEWQEKLKKINKQK